MTIPLPHPDQPTLPPESLTPAAPFEATVPGYEILEELGRGGMGVVYKARQIKADRIVALKMILAGGHAGHAERLRFQREAEAVARLQHPGVVQVFEVGEHEGLPFFSLEFCEGGSLEKKLGGVPLSPKDGAAVVRWVALAIHSAHQRNIVHRDLKPANVLLAADGTPKVTDFGLAKKLDEVSQTASNAVMGTPSYMSPEQAAGKVSEIGPATDVYALGVILYECLTGRPPFRAESALETVLQVVHNEPAPPRQVNPKVPVDLETICLKCLRKEPGRRYASAALLADDLLRFQSGEPIAARPVGLGERCWRWCRRNPAIAALLGAVAATLLAGTAVAITLAWQAKAEADRADEAARLARTNEQAALAEKQRTADALAKAEQEKLQKQEQLDFARRNLLTAQLLRVAAVAGRDTYEAKELLHDLKACPLDGRDATWRFWERVCDRRERDVWPVETGVTSSAWSPDGLCVAVGSDNGAVRVWDVGTGQPKTIFQGHTDSVYAVAFSPDGLTLATASFDTTVRLWDVKTGQAKATLIGHTDPVRAVAFSPDGETVASGGQDKTIRLWDVKTEKLRAVLSQHKGWVYSVAFSPDGASLASGSEDRTIRLWDVKTAQPRGTLPGHASSVRSVAFSPDGLSLASASDDLTVRLWDVVAERLKLTFPGNINFTSVAFSPDGLTLAGGSMNTMVALWDVRTGQRKAIFHGHTAPVYSVSFSPDGLTLFSGSRGFRNRGEVRLWHLAADQELAVIKGHSASVTTLAYSPDGQALAAGGDDRTVRLLDAKTGRERGTLNGHTDRVSCVAFSPDSSTLASAGDETVRLWDLKTERARVSLKHPSAVHAVAFSPDARSLATGCADKLVRLWDVKTGKELTAFPGHTAEVYSVAFAPDGQSVASGSWDKTIRLWNVKGGDARAILQGHTDRVWSVAFSPDGRTLASGSADQTVRLWDVATGQPRIALVGHTSTVPSVAFSPDGLTVVSTSGERDEKLRRIVGGEVRLWDVKTGQQRVALQGHSGMVLCAAFDPEGQTLATGSTGLPVGDVRLWDLKSGRERVVLQGHLQPVTATAFSPDGRWLVSGAGEVGKPGEVRLWDLTTGQLIASPQGHANRVTGVAFSPDGQWLASCSGDSQLPNKPGEVRLWNGKTGQPAVALRGHTDKVEAVEFGDDARVLYGLDLSGEVWAWDVSTGEEVEAKDLPQFAAPGQPTVSPGGGLQAVARGTEVVVIDTAAVARDRLERLALEAVVRERWHAERAGQAEQAGEWFAALVHLDGLLRDRPNDVELTRRRDAVLANLKRGREGQAPPRMDKLDP